MTFTRLAPYWEYTAFGLFNTSGNLLIQLKQEIYFSAFFLSFIKACVLAHALMEARLTVVKQNKHELTILSFGDSSNLQW